MAKYRDPLSKKGDDSYTNREHKAKEVPRVTMIVDTTHEKLPTVSQIADPEPKNADSYNDGGPAGRNSDCGPWAEKVQTVAIIVGPQCRQLPRWWTR